MAIRIGRMALAPTLLLATTSDSYARWLPLTDAATGWEEGSTYTPMPGWYLLRMEVVGEATVYMNHRPSGGSYQVSAIAPFNRIVEFVDGDSFLLFQSSQGGSEVRILLIPL